MTAFPLGQGGRGSPINTQNWTTASAKEQRFVAIQINLVNVIIIMVAIIILVSAVIASVLFVVYRKKLGKANRNVMIYN